ncbi:MAG: hypothetical protein MJK18_07080, partial [Bdellovibrionales bacterium]|nr:hypothetical protein [Bdellovibrionales bacterium]
MRKSKNFLLFFFSSWLLVATYFALGNPSVIKFVDYVKSFSESAEPQVSQKESYKFLRSTLKEYYTIDQNSIEGQKRQFLKDSFSEETY